jgi:hypothetical protein
MREVRHFWFCLQCWRYFSPYLLQVCFVSAILFSFNKNISALLFLFTGIGAASRLPATDLLRHEFRVSRHTHTATQVCIMLFWGYFKFDAFM